MAQYVCYHANCNDGFGSAWAAHKKFGDSATYIPVSYGNPLPDVGENNDVLIVDFSYPRETLMHLRAFTKSLQVLDHHKSAEEDLRGLPYCEFDMNRSGAMMTWNYLFPEQRAPRLIKYVQDRDLWVWELYRSKEVSAWLSSYPFDFAIWDSLAEDLEERPEDVFHEGIALLRYKQQQVESMVRHPRTVEIGGHKVLAVNATVNFSEVADLLCERNPELPFAAYWIDRSDNKRQWGLRSRGGFDVSAVAKQYGGGGHAAASGFVENSLQDGILG